MAGYKKDFFTYVCYLRGLSTEKKWKKKLCHLQRKKPMWVFFFFSFFFFFFGGEDWPWAHICCPSSSFCWRKIVSELHLCQYSSTLCGTLPQHGLMSSARSSLWIRTCKPQAEDTNLTTTPPGQLLFFIFSSLCFLIVKIQKRCLEKVIHICHVLLLLPPALGSTKFSFLIQRSFGHGL